MRDDANVGVRAGFAALRRDRVELVDEDDRRRVMAGFAEDAAQIAFGLAGIRADDVGAVDVVEPRFDFVRDGARHARLARARAARRG